MTALLILLGVLGGTGYLLWLVVPWLGAEVARLYADAETEFKLGLIAAILSTAGVVWSVIYQRRREAEALRFERKREAYTAFFNLLFEFMKAQDEGADLLADPDLKNKWRELTKQLMIWADARTINAFNEFQSTTVADGEDLRATSEGVESLMRQFRADLGHRDRKLRKFALTKLLVKGDEHYKLDG